MALLPPDQRAERLPRRLFLDDARVCPVGWVPCRTADDFRFLVSRYTWDDISFDYYLSDETETGLDLLIWMFAHGYRPTNRPAVHTSSLPKMLIMEKYLSEVWPK